MADIKFNNKTISEAYNDVKFNGTRVPYVNYNGTRVWTAKNQIEEVYINIDDLDFPHGDRTGRIIRWQLVEDGDGEMIATTTFNPYHLQKSSYFYMDYTKSPILKKVGGDSDQPMGTRVDRGSGYAYSHDSYALAEGLQAFYKTVHYTGTIVQLQFDKGTNTKTISYSDLGLSYNEWVSNYKYITDVYLALSGTNVRKISIQKDFKTTSSGLVITYTSSLSTVTRTVEIQLYRGSALDVSSLISRETNYTVVTPKAPFNGTEQFYLKLMFYRDMSYYLLTSASTFSFRNTDDRPIYISTTDKPVFNKRGEELVTIQEIQPGGGYTGYFSGAAERTIWISPDRVVFIQLTISKGNSEGEYTLNPDTF